MRQRTRHAARPSRRYTALSGLLADGSSSTGPCMVLPARGRGCECSPHRDERESRQVFTLFARTSQWTDCDWRLVLAGTRSTGPEDNPVKREER